MTREINMPATPPRSLQAMLRRVTELFAWEMSAAKAHTPDWPQEMWAVARAVVLMHGIAPLLSRADHWSQNPTWRAFLEEQCAHTVGRYDALASLRDQIHFAATRYGIAVVPLKGAALHAAGLYTRGERPMADLDLLVRRDDSARAQQLLRELGFVESMSTWKERVFVPATARASRGFGDHVEHDVKIELHERICERLPCSLVDITQRVFPSAPVSGMNPYPSTAALFEHLLFHAAGSMTSKTLRLIHLHDLVRLSARMSPSDWSELLERRDHSASLWWAFPPLSLASRYGADVPAGVLNDLAARCPPLLSAYSKRTGFFDVSMSYLWVNALPGILWSRTLSEAWTYGSQRVRPGRDHLAQREHTAQTQAWARMSSWTHLSQAERVLRWLASRPMRPATLYVVKAALSGAC